VFTHARQCDLICRRIFRNLLGYFTSLFWSATNPGMPLTQAPRDEEYQFLTGTALTVAQLKIPYRFSGKCVGIDAVLRSELTRWWVWQWFQHWSWTDAVHTLLLRTWLNESIYFDHTDSQSFHQVETVSGIHAIKLARLSWQHEERWEDWNKYITNLIFASLIKFRWSHRQFYFRTADSLVLDDI